jgi:hypothetical protein
MGAHMPQASMPLRMTFRGEVSVGNFSSFIFSPLTATIVAY